MFDMLLTDYIDIPLMTPYIVDIVASQTNSTVITIMSALNYVKISSWNVKSPHTILGIESKRIEKQSINRKWNAKPTTATFFA